MLINLTIYRTNNVMPRRGMGVEIYQRYSFHLRILVMPRRGMGVEIGYFVFLYRYNTVMPRRGMGVEMRVRRRRESACVSCPAGAWE